ncbi:MAG: YidC/Oxa1 family insertase periplasmic-domain containing protein [Victivallales bacterium]|nr:YidC/Oxa1 family insertase periplasmic-domain containing protein [Victivallales bacterium]
MADKSKYDPVTIFGVTACLLMLLGMPFVMRKMAPPPQPAPGVDVSQPAANVPAATSQTAEVGATDAVSPSSAPDGTGDAAASSAQPNAGKEIASVSSVSTPFPPSALAPVSLERTGEAVIALNPEWGGCDSVVLQDYLVSKNAKDGTSSPRVSLGNHDYPFLRLVAPGLTGGRVTVDEANPKVARLVRTLADGAAEVTETWDASTANSYEILYSVKVRNLTAQPLVLQDWMVSAGAMPPSITPDRKASRGENAGGASLGRGAGSKPTDLAMKKLVKMDGQDRAKLASTPANWAAVHSKYFLLGLWMSEPGASFPGAEAAAVPSIHQEGVATEPEGRYCLRVILPAANVAAGATGEWSMTAYAGPKKCERLYAIGNGIASVMGIDWFFMWRPVWMAWISRALLGGMLWIRGFFPASIGFGMGVILLTVLVRILFWPLSHKSTVSMRRMQALKPQLDELKAKYKDDPQTLYRKQRELFKENNVSQLGGCLPMLLQIPVFFALFNTFRNAIELRHASFLWAYDLSMPDTLSFSPESLPIRPFAILMAATMFVQQKMTPNPDPNSSKMMSFMTIFFMFLFYGMPSALTLYLTVSYLLGILQTYITNKMVPMDAALQTTAKTTTNGLRQ